MPYSCSGFSLGRRMLLEGNEREQKAGGYSGYDRECLCRWLLLPANPGGMAGSVKDHSPACFGIWVLSRDRHLRRCGFWNCSGTSFGRSRITRGARGEHFAATDSVYGSHDVSCLAQRTSFCCSRRLTSRTGSGERRLNTSPKFVRSFQRTSAIDLGAT